MKTRTLMSCRIETVVPFQRSLKARIPAIALGMCSFAGSISAAPDPTSNTPTVNAVAARVISSCVTYAATNQLPPLSIAVVDATGALVRFERQQGAAPLTAEAAVLKARTSLRADGPSESLGADLSDASVRDAYLELYLTTMPGGLLLKSKSGLLLGAVGVSGAPTAQDAECARRAAATVAE